MPLTVTELYEASRTPLSLEIECGEAHMGNVIREEALNRPGLALAGFFQYFAHRRVQVLGLAEFSYLKSFSGSERQHRLRQFFEQHVPCVVVTRNRRPFGTLLALANEFQVPVLRTPMITGKFINAATLITERLVSPTTRVQGTMVDILGIGVIIEGAAGIGKSETALELIERGHSLVADDVTVIRKDSAGLLIGSPVDITRYHMEIRGLGIIHVPSLFGVASMRGETRLDLIVRLHRPDPKIEDDRTGLAPATRELLDTPVPFIRLPVGPGRSMANVIEVAALNQKLKRLGHDAAKELDDQIVRRLAEGGGVG